jgi:hypothetical protein
MSFVDAINILKCFFKIVCSTFGIKKEVEVLHSDPRL